jgi:hypothetical protein
MKSEQMKEQRELDRAWQALMILATVSAGLALVISVSTTCYVAGDGNMCMAGATGAASLSVTLPVHEYPCQYESGMLGAYMEDGSDKSGDIDYDPIEIRKLEWFTFDITPVALSRCLSTMGMLDSSTKIGVHPEVDSTEVLGAISIGEKTPAAWAVHMRKYIDKQCPGLSDKVKMIILEPEGMDEMYGGIGNKVVGGLNYLYRNSYGDLEAAFRAVFTNLDDNGISQYATDPTSLTHTASPNIVLEGYNTWSGDVCIPFQASSGCKVDFNTTASGGLKFPGAICGPPTAEHPAGYLCPTKGCPPDREACLTKAHPCGPNVAYGGGVYDPLLPLLTAPWTPYQRGGYFGSILADYLGNHERPMQQTRFILFPFTDASCPTLYGVIQTPDEFDRFIQGWKDAMAQPKGPFTYKTMASFIYGAWGVPKWLT